MKQELTKIIYISICMGLLIATVSFFYLAYVDFKPYYESSVQVKALEDIAVINDVSDTEADSSNAMLRHIEFDKLKAVNDKIIGWLYIPDADIDYPILQGEEYLYKSFDGSYSELGSIFTWSDSPSNLSEDHVCLFGHKTSTGQMFGNLCHITTDSNYYCYIYTPNSTKKAKIYDVRTCDSNAEIFQDDWNTGCEDQVFSLATCVDYTATPYRYVVSWVVIDEKINE